MKTNAAKDKILITSKELYTKVLNLPRPWRVGVVEWKIEEKELWVEVLYRQGTRFVCPQCGRKCPGYDHRTQQWRHLDTGGVRTFLHGHLPRIECAEHGVLEAAVPWADRFVRVTHAMEAHVIALLKSEMPVATAGRMTGLAWHTVWSIVARAVERGKRRKPQRVLTNLMVDEKARARGHEYVTLVASEHQDAAVVEHIEADRTTEALASYWRGLSPQQLAQIESIAMDLHRPYWEATVTHVPKAEEKIVHDRFHLMKHVQAGVNTVRKQEHRMLTEEGFDLLKGTKYLWLTNRERWTATQRHDFKVIQRADLKTSKAWAMKETIKHLWEYSYVGAAKNFFQQWTRWTRQAKLRPMIKVAERFERHLPNILTFCRLPASTAGLENLNGKIARIIRAARGIYDLEHFKTLIYFHCGGLDLNPLRVT
jgi:transposase